MAVPFLYGPYAHVTATGALPPGTEWHWWFGPWPWYADAVAVTAHPIALEGADRMMEVTRVWSHATPTGDRFIECIVRNVGPDAANYAVWVGGVAP